MYPRLISPRIQEALMQMPVVFVVGPRRAGKSTLVQYIARHQRPYITLDEQSICDAARQDPTGFVRPLDTVIIDEVQRAPELLLAIKKAVDEDPRPGRFLLTGSVSVLTLPRISDSLIGRMRVITLLPLARSEILETTPSFLERLFHHDFQSLHPAPHPLVGDACLQTVVSGGFPELLAQHTSHRQAWVRDYISGLTLKDVRDISHIAKLSELPKFTHVVAQYSAKLVNYSTLGQNIHVTHKTAQHYLGLLEHVFLITLLQPWHTHTLKRLIKTPKLHLLDSGLLATMRHLTPHTLKQDRHAYGSLLESFVVSEILKLMHASSMWITPYHFRYQQKHEVDLVLERNDGKVVGIEIKAQDTVRHADFSGLRILQEACKKRFAGGIILCDRTDTVPFADKLAAVPISLLWD